MILRILQVGILVYVLTDIILKASYLTTEVGASPYWILFAKLTSSGADRIGDGLAEWTDFRNEAT